MKKPLIILFGLILSVSQLCEAQKKEMTHEDKALWNRIRNVNISNSGEHVLYELEKGEKDKTIHLLDINGNPAMSYPRTKGGQFSYDSKYAVFAVNAWKDSINEMKRRKVKKKDLPKDSLFIYNIESKSIQKIPNVKSYKLPEKWSGIVAYMLEEKKEAKKEKDTSGAKPKDTLKTKVKDSTKTKKPKKVSKDNGFHLVIRQLASGAEDTLKYVHAYQIAKEGKFLTYATSGVMDEFEGGVYYYNVETGTRTPLFTSHDKTKYPQLGISESGERIGFVVDTDSTKSLIKKPVLYAWDQEDDTLKQLLKSEENPTSLFVSGDEKLRFSENEERLFFGLRTKPIVQDTTLIEDEIVIDGVHFRFIDTAGIRDTEDQIEKIGVERTLSKMKEASLILYLIDVSQDTREEIENQTQELENLGVPFVLVGNKVDKADQTLIQSLERDSRFVLRHCPVL